MLALVLLLAAAHGVGGIFARWRQPRVIGEIAGGLLLGPTLFGYILPEMQQSLLRPDAAVAAALGAISQIGLLLLLFGAGAELGSITKRSELRTTAVITAAGLVVPFAAGTAAIRLLNLGSLQGPAHSASALTLVFGAAVAVTSIPVISRIMIDLEIVGTSFGRIVLGVAVIEDIALYAVLAIAVGLAQTGQVGLARELGVDPTSAAGAGYYAAVTILVLVAAVTLGRHLFGTLARTRSKGATMISPVAWLLIGLFMITLGCLELSITPIFGGLAAGIMVGALANNEFADAVTSIVRFGFGFFVPVYFALIGLQLDLIHKFDPAFFLVFLLFACIVKAGSVYFGARLAGETVRASGNFALALNARGGPGIVLAYVALQARIISENFYVSLVMLALVTSLVAGSWLERTVRSGHALRTVDPAIVPPLRHAAPDSDVGVSAAVLAVSDAPAPLEHD